MDFDTKKHDFIFSLLESFGVENNYEIAIATYVNKLCKEYNFDKVSTFFNNREDNTFKLLHSYDVNENFKMHEDYEKLDDSVETDINDYTVLMSKCDIKREHNILKFFSDSKTIYSRDVYEIYDKFALLDFSCEINKVKEIFIYAIINNDCNRQDILGYCVFEKYKNEYMTKDGFKELNAFLNLMEVRIRDNEKIKANNKKHQITKAIAETTQLDKYLMIVEKETFNIFYYNNLMGETLPNNAMNEKCYKIIFDKNKPCQNCPVVNNTLNETTFSSNTDGDYLVRVTEINWKSKKDAFVLTSVDVSKYIASKLSHDSLTESLTWYGLKEKIKSEYDKNQKYAYVSLDIDGLKLINDVHTKVVGNEILKQIILSLKKVAKEGEYFCRIVADEFALILKYVDENNLDMRVKRLEFALSRMFNEIFSEIHIVISGGIFIIENDLLLNLDNAFENSRLARNTAKGVYKHNFVLYHDEIRDDLKNTKYIEDKVDLAIANDEFVVYLQPKFSLETNKIVGAEALVRWEMTNEMIFPDTFIPIFEKNGFILTLDFIIYNKVFGFMKECIDENRNLIPISINASRNHLSNTDFLDRLLILIQLYNIPKEFIEVEITENASEGSDDKLHEFVRALKKEGLKVSMDDFGSAYSSLNLLKTLDIDTLKLDKAFLDGMRNEELTELISRDEIIVKNIVNMANELKFNVLCEGIETSEQIEFLKKISCDYGQGYVFSRPLPLAQFKEKFL